MSVIEKILKYKELYRKTRLAEKKIARRPAVRHARRPEFSETLRTKLRHNWQSIKKLALIGVISFMPMNTQARTTDSRSSATETTSIWDMLEEIEKKVRTSLKRLAGNINRNMDLQQAELTKAKRSGRTSKRRHVKHLFDYTCPGADFSGNENYCVAGAMYVHMRCNDPIMNTILPNFEKDKNFPAGNPLTSCPAAISYFEKKIPNRTARSNQAKFKQLMTTLQPGDLIFVYSRQNTTSGLHCVTVSGKMKDGKISARSLNNESNYDVDVRQIRGAVAIMAEYEERLRCKYLEDMNVAEVQNLDEPRDDASYAMADSVVVTPPNIDQPKDSVPTSEQKAPSNASSPERPTPKSTVNVKTLQRTTARTVNNEDLPLYLRRNTEADIDESLSEPLPTSLRQRRQNSKE